jgi:hypothetical protein
VAKIVEEFVIVKVSKLVRDGQEATILPADFAPTVEALASEVIGDPSVLVEVSAGSQDSEISE